MFNFINLSDARSIVPIALIALAGIAAWFLWTRAKRNDAEANAAASSAYNASAAGVPNTGSLMNLALLQSLFSGSSPAQGASGQVTYSAPVQPNTGSNAAPAPVSSGSSTGNTPVSQGV